MSVSHTHTHTHKHAQRSAHSHTCCCSVGSHGSVTVEQTNSVINLWPRSLLGDISIDFGEFIFGAEVGLDLSASFVCVTASSWPWFLEISRLSVSERCALIPFLLVISPCNIYVLPKQQYIVAHEAWNYSTARSIPMSSFRQLVDVVSASMRLSVQHL